MRPVYLDFHIHTSKDPNNPNENYDVDELKNGIEKVSCGTEYLVSLTDHNFINTPVYVRAKGVLNRASPTEPNP